MNEETTAMGIAPEMTIPDAVNIARQEAAKSEGEIRSALTMLADYAMPLIPHDEPAPESKPQIGMGEWNPLEIPEIGISFRRFFSSRYDKYIAAWNDGCNSHVYELVVQSHGDGWEAIGTNDGGTVFRLQAPSRHLVRRIACASMRAYLTRGHRKTWSKRRIESAATPPLNRATPFKDLKPRSGDLKRSDLTSEEAQS